MAVTPTPSFQKLTHDYPRNIPIPDPSLITVQEIDKASETLREEFTRALEMQRELLQSNGLARHDKAMLAIAAVAETHDRFEENLNRVPTQLDRETQRIGDLFDQKLQVIRTGLEGFRTMVLESRERNRQAVQAAFDAAEKIAQTQQTSFAQQIAKVETSSNKELDAVKVLLNASKDALVADLRNLTGRLDRGEGTHLGARQEVSDRHATIGTQTGIIAQVIAFTVVVVMLGGLWLAVHSQNPIVSMDTKRVDDLISQMNDQNRGINARLDALSARINQTTPQLIPPASR